MKEHKIKYLNKLNIEIDENYQLKYYMQNMIVDTLLFQITEIDKLVDLLNGNIKKEHEYIQNLTK